MLTTMIVAMISQPTFFSSVSWVKNPCFCDISAILGGQCAEACRLTGIGASVAGLPTIVRTTL
ncbi:hypothetical protein D3C72_763470 [compost metagenome]